MIDLLVKDDVLEVLQELQNTLQDTDIDFKLLPSEDGVIDAFIQIKGETFACQYKKNISMSTIGALEKTISDMRRYTHYPILVLTDKLPVTVALRFKNEHVHFADAAGNCFIRSSSFIINIEGRKSRTAPKPKSTHNLFKGTVAVRIVFALLNDPTLIQETIRIIATKTKASVGSVKNVIDELTAENYVVIDEDKRYLKLKKELLDRWVLAYNEILKPKLFKGYLDFRDPKDEVRWSEMPLPDMTVWGGENAAYLYDGYIRPGDYALYTFTSMIRFVQYGFHPSNHGKIAVYEKFWTSEADQQAPMLLTYADLLGSGISRNIEAAERILENELHYFER